MLTLIIYLLLTFPTKLFVEQKLKFENYVAKFHFRNRLLLGICFHFLKQWNKNLRHGKCRWEVSPVALFTCMSLSKRNVTDRRCGKKACVTRECSLPHLSSPHPRQHTVILFPISGLLFLPKCTRCTFLLCVRYNLTYFLSCIFFLSLFFLFI